MNLDDRTLTGGLFLDEDLAEYRVAVTGKGPRASEWAKKPHRLVYDLIRMCQEERNRSAELQALAAGQEMELEARDRLVGPDGEFLDYADVLELLDSTAAENEQLREALEAASPPLVEIAWDSTGDPDNDLALSEALCEFAMELLKDHDGACATTLALPAWGSNYEPTETTGADNG